MFNYVMIFLRRDRGGDQLLLGDFLVWLLHYCPQSTSVSEEQKKREKKNGEALPEASSYHRHRYFLPNAQ